MKTGLRISKELQKDSLICMVISELENMLADRGLVVTAGLGEEAGNKPESYYVEKKGEKVQVFGSDPAGLAYGLQDLTETLWEGKEDSDRWGKLISPEMKIRGVDRFIMNSDDEIWWMNASYWRYYIGMLALCRFNRLCVTVGFDTEYMSPPYPFLVDVEGFEDVSAVMRADRKQYLEALRTIGQICHEFHMEFSFAIWQQQPWQKDDRQLIYGLETQERLCEYCRKGIAALLYECPEIDNIHFRVNHESGVGNKISAEEYWLKQIDMVGEVNCSGRKIKLELRAKGMTDRMVQKALEDGLSVTVSTKYCCEHAGLPYHLTQMRSQELAEMENLNASRRYSYADLLKKPRAYDLLYRLWCDGSTDLFLWGDPDYVRKFICSMQVGDAEGFEVMPPLSLKGGREFDRHTGWNIFEKEEYRTGIWEDDRYWLFYLLYGRLGYDRMDGGAAWRMEGERRLGKNAEPAFLLTSFSSKILPLITGFHFTEHPQLWYWPEMSTGAALFAENNYHPEFRRQGDTYQDTLPCDEGLFYSITEYVKAGKQTDGRYTPMQVYDWLNRIARKLRELLMEAGKREGNAEWKGTVLDAEMLCELVQFHREKIAAALGLSYYLYQREGIYLEEAVVRMKQAEEHWKRLSVLGEAYHNNLLFGAGIDCWRRGTWKDYLPEIRKDIEDLKNLRDIWKKEKGRQTERNMDGKRIIRPVLDEHPVMHDTLPLSHHAGRDLTAEVICNTKEVPDLTIHYRHTDQTEGIFMSKKMKRTESGYTVVLDGDYIRPEWDLLIYFSATNRQGDGMIYPGLEAEGDQMPYRMIRIET